LLFACLIEGIRPLCPLSVSELSLANCKFGDVAIGILGKLAEKEKGDYKFGDVTTNMLGKLGRFGAWQALCVGI